MTLENKIVRNQTLRRYCKRQTDASTHGMHYAAKDGVRKNTDFDEFHPQANCRIIDC